MKFTVCVVLVALVACSVQASPNWGQKIRNLKIKFENLVDRKAQKTITHVKAAEYSLKNDVNKFFKHLEKKINSTVEAAIEDMEILRHEVSVECYTNATKKLMAAEQAAVENLLACQNMSQAYQDVEKIAQQSQPIILDITQDVKVIIEGVAECGTDTGLAQWQCVFKYVTEEVKNLINQWPDAKRFIQTAEALGRDAERQVNACVNSPSQVNLDKEVKEALNEFSACSQQSMI